MAKMAEEENNSGEDKTEEATPERREEFRERGQVAVSREITSVLVLALAFGFLFIYIDFFIMSLKNIFYNHYERIPYYRISKSNFLSFMGTSFYEVFILIVPLFAATTITAIIGTFLQTRFNFSWKKLQPDFSRMDPLKGIARFVSPDSLMELLKGIGKMATVSAVAYVVLYAEWAKVPGLMMIGIHASWTYWLDITKDLVFGVALLLLAIGGADYFYNFMTLEKKLRMTKKELRDDYKRREVDPQVKGRMRRMARDLVSKQIVEKTKTATVIITNPTHYSIALRYELGMRAPVVVAKGKDFLALQMREVAEELGIPRVENKPLARTLYKTVEMGMEIPEALYKAVSEVIRYVFKLKGMRVKS
jgi:flagellar biosynthesis protein FlhB